MVDVGSGVFTGIRGVDARLVVSESIDNLECDGHWAMLVNGNLQLLLVPLSDVEGATLDSKGISTLLDSAFFVMSEIWICSLGTDTTSVLDVLKCM